MDDLTIDGDLDEAAYTIDEIVRRAPIGRSSIYKAIKDRRLVARKDGRRTVILKSDYVRYLRSLPPVEPDQGKAKVWPR
jgi:hypothetical protein